MRRQLAQSRPSDTNAASILSDVRPWEVDLIVITNVGVDAASASVYHDADGTTYDETTAILFDTTIYPNMTLYYSFPQALANVGAKGNLGFKSGSANMLNVTVYGEIKGEAL